MFKIKKNLRNRPILRSDMRKNHGLTLAQLDRFLNCNVVLERCPFTEALAMLSMPVTMRPRRASVLDFIEPSHNRPSTSSEPPQPPQRRMSMFAERPPYRPVVPEWLKGLNETDQAKQNDEPNPPVAHCSKNPPVANFPTNPAVAHCSKNPPIQQQPVSSTPQKIISRRATTMVDNEQPRQVQSRRMSDAELMPPPKVIPPRRTSQTAPDEESTAALVSMDEEPANAAKIEKRPLATTIDKTEPRSRNIQPVDDMAMDLNVGIDTNTDRGIGIIIEHDADKENDPNAANATNAANSLENIRQAFKPFKIKGRRPSLVEKHAIFQDSDSD